MASIEHLESFPVDHQDPTKLLRARKGLSLEAKKGLKGFLCRKIDVVTWGMKIW